MAEERARASPTDPTCPHRRTHDRPSPSARGLATPPPRMDGRAGVAERLPRRMHLRTALDPGGRPRVGSRHSPAAPRASGPKRLPHATWCDDVVAGGCGLPGRAIADARHTPSRLVIDGWRLVGARHHQHHDLLGTPSDPQLDRLLPRPDCGRGSTIWRRPRQPTCTTFKQNSDRSLVDVPAVFTQYGGVTATGVGPIAGSSEGWLIAGNRLSGPGALGHRRSQRLHQGRGRARADGSHRLRGNRPVGRLGRQRVDPGRRRGTARVDGRPGPGRLDLLRRAEVGARGRAVELNAQDMHRAVLLPNGHLQAVGLSGDGFASWTRTDRGWQPAVEFGRVAGSWRGTPYVASAATTQDELLATVSTGDTYELWGTPLGNLGLAQAPCPDAPSHRERSHPDGGNERRPSPARRR